MNQFKEGIIECSTCKDALTYLDEEPCKTCMEHDDFPDTLINWNGPNKLMEKDGYKYELPF